ncbi:MAG: GC-type dockerin domain-anchored protein, partial [bacterium]
GGVDGDDVITFFADWDSASPAADVDGSGGVDGDDVILFFERWDAGC